MADDQQLSLPLAAEISDLEYFRVRAGGSPLPVHAKHEAQANALESGEMELTFSMNYDAWDIDPAFLSVDDLNFEFCSGRESAKRGSLVTELSGYDPLNERTIGKKIGLAWTWSRR